MKDLRRYWFLWFVVIPAFAVLNWITFGWHAALAIAVGMVVSFWVGRILG